MTNKNEVRKPQISFSIHPVKSNGEIVFTATYGAQGYSQYYENDLRYNEEDAEAHKVELENKFSHQGFAIVREITTFELV